MFFILTAFILMQKLCPSERDKLLRQLNIPIPDFAHFNDNDYTSLNKKIYQKICEMMDSQSDIEGYEKLLKLGGMERNNDTRRECIARIVANREKILQEVTKQTDDKISDETNSSSYLPLIIGIIFLAVGISYALISDEPNFFIISAGCIIGLAIIGFSLFDDNNKSEPQSQTTTTLSVEQIKNILPILEQINKIYNLIGF